MNDQYQKYYSDDSFREKLKKFAKTAGLQVVYAALLLYFLIKEPKVPLKAKITIGAALGYFILPTDAIPDLAPFIGFSDDLGVLIFALSQISDHITPEVQTNAKQQLINWFKQIDQEEIDKLHDKIF
ncbi:YkvA family protein [Sunxiuqinia sp. A32]|uniref:YkvA family protein n=1 Tax=Sunxiuqinia sp. A32 TaxID=3461496 RepID=UPI004046840E